MHTVKAVFLLSLILRVPFYKCNCPSPALVPFFLWITPGPSLVRNSLTWKRSSPGATLAVSTDQSASRPSP